MSVEDAVRREARSLGFCAIGFAEAGPALSVGWFREWLTEGLHGGMDWLARRAGERSDPRLLLPGARTVIVAAARYECATVPGPYSSYAWGADYHNVLRSKLKTLAIRIENAVGRRIRARVCVDSAPILEREWAVRAGLGWLGRQGALVNPQHGCCLVLGEVLTDLALEPSQPLAGQCGDCRRCLDACPTAAVKPNGMLDARRCLAYLTIEHRDELPADTSLFGCLCGCDRCTMVCPFNPPPAQSEIMPELRGDPARYPTRSECMGLDQAAFEHAFRGTAVLRVGLARLKRNAGRPSVLTQIIGH